MEQVVIVDYGSGNLHSAEKAFERAAREAGLTVRIHVSGKPDAVASADRIVLPGVGAYGDCRTGLHAVDGLWEAIEQRVRGDGRPFLGICVGMQLMATEGLEHGHHAGFGWLSGAVGPIQPTDATLKVPHMGWNTLSAVRPHPVFDGMPLGPDGWHAYFVHSFHLTDPAEGDLIATTDYGGRITAVAGRDNLVGTQFHPEKSQMLGLALIANFLRWRP